MANKNKKKISINRIFLIYALFIILAVAVAVFIYNYKDDNDRWVREQASKITGCEGLTDENECFSTENCEGIFAPSCPGCQDMVFQRCQQVPAKAAAKLAAEKQLCEDTGGQWYRSKYGSYCICEPGVSYERGRGCLKD